MLRKNNINDSEFSSSSPSPRSIRDSSSHIKQINIGKQYSKSEQIPNKLNQLAPSNENTRKLSHQPNIFEVDENLDEEFQEGESLSILQKN